LQRTQVALGRLAFDYIAAMRTGITFVALAAHPSRIARKKHIGGGFRYVPLFIFAEGWLAHRHLRPENERFHEALQLL